MKLGEITVFYAVTVSKIEARIKIVALSLLEEYIISSSSYLLLYHVYFNPLSASVARK